ncbi:hypothetical protein [Geomonas agri]|uniref:hypothetical protein n=1 Tax=Geomonas agri TaxID=2873702 RepID=UPI001CD7A6B3|nr:hypothetical protein [Geomonas agri]
MNKFTKVLIFAIALALPAVGQCADAGSKNEKSSAGKVYKVSELFTGKAALDKQKVTVKGKVVKVSGGIMDRNWIHLQDGSGSSNRQDNDLTVTTTQALPTVGKIVTITGTLAKDKDFGSGYFYKVIVENATIRP